MTMEEKDGISHRADALKKFAEWYLKKFGAENML
ncbi:MAG: non-canonical purine NTP pyrophosphatase [Candidatus Bathyarchaeota archaeon]|nr:non-canonical purine NTP pyrophosphatase [Candidatus Bathyarchaeota archaeon]